MILNEEITNISDVITNYFPYTHPREGQMEIIKEIQKAIDYNDYNHVIIDAPTGFGKSAVARTFCDYYSRAKQEKSYILTATKMLQNQYFQECKDNNYVNYKMGLGRGNYTCLQNGLDCNNGECKFTAVNEKSNCKYKMIGHPCNNGGCTYWSAKCSAINSDVAIMNYHVLLTDNLFIKHYPNRFLGICDEAHNIEKILMSFMKISISQQKLKKLDIKLTNYDFKHGDLDFWISIMELVIEKANEKLVECLKYNAPKKDAEEVNNIINGFSYKLEQLQKKNMEWIVCPVKTKRTVERVEIKPLRISPYAYNLLKSAKHHIFMSGTLIDPVQFCEDIGLDSPDDIYYARAKSNFDVSNKNKIFKCYAGSLTTRNKEKTKPFTIPVLKKIFKEHAGECGLIHANSKDFAYYIYNNINSDRLLIYKSSKDKNDKIKVFEESDDKIMVSYSLQEGLDLPDDNIRFQVFYKVPYPYLGDEQIKARATVEPNWYNVETVRTILQAWGRGMRSENDYCTNYLIDESFERILNDESFANLVPDEFRDAIQKGDD